MDFDLVLEHVNMGGSLCSPDSPDAQWEGQRITYVGEKRRTVRCTRREHARGPRSFETATNIRGHQRTTPWLYLAPPVSQGPANVSACGIVKVHLLPRTLCFSFLCAASASFLPYSSSLSPFRLPPRQHNAMLCLSNQRLSQTTPSNSFQLLCHSFDLSSRLNPMPFASTLFLTCLAVPPYPAYFLFGWPYVYNFARSRGGFERRELGVNTFSL
jgi:hypothetical protein